MRDDFWSQIQDVLSGAALARTADELISTVRKGPSQESGAGDAFFAGSGGDDQLIEVLEDSGYWTCTRIESDYWWKAQSKLDASVVEYVEGDLYRRS